jgi:hypothetical protein
LRQTLVICATEVDATVAVEVGATVEVVVGEAVVTTAVVGAAVVEDEQRLKLEEADPLEIDETKSATADVFETS